MRVVILGGGSAGVSAATHLRRNDENAEIIIIEPTEELAVSSCGLPYMIAGKIKDKDELIGATPTQMRQIFNIDVRLNTEVLSWNVAEKRLFLSGGESLVYDKIILAMSGLQLRPDISGVLRDTVLTLSTLSSAQKISDYFRGLDARRVIVLGGGLVGLKTAEVLTQAGASVTVIDKRPHLLEDFDYDTAAKIKNILEDSGLNIITGTSLKEFMQDKVILSNGRRLKYDMAVAATGSSSDMRLPVMADVRLGETGGILVDKNMKTSVEDVFACGGSIELEDMITHLPQRLKNAADIIRSAKIAADNACGIQTRFEKFLPCRLMTLFDILIGISGANEDRLNAAGIPYFKLYFSQPSAETYLQPSPVNGKLLFGLDGALLGAQLFGKNGVESRLNTLAALMAQGANITDLTTLPRAYAPEFSKAKDVLNNLGSLAEEILSGGLKTADLSNLKEDDILLNVCAPAKFEQFNKVKALHIPLFALRDTLASLPKDKKIILSCGGGYAAYLAYRILTQRGFERVFLLNSPDVWA